MRSQRQGGVVIRGFQARGWDQARDCIPSVKPRGRSTKAKRREVPPSWSCAARKGRCGLALGFGLLAFGLGLGLFLAFRLGGLLALRFGGRRRCRGLRPCRRSGGGPPCRAGGGGRRCRHHPGAGRGVSFVPPSLLDWEFPFPPPDSITPPCPHP